MTTSYKAGTVSVSAGSKRVTGISTGWILANISPGYFGLNDGQGSVIPVEAIISDTELDLFVPWSGPSLSGQEYWLSYDTRDGQQTVNNAQRLAEYVARLDSEALSAISGLEPSANKIIKFTGESAATLVDFGTGAEDLLTGGVIPNLQLPERLRITGSVSTDANTIIENGWYVVAGTAANLPEAQPGVIVHSVISSQFMAQEYTRRGTNIIYQRSSSGGVWGAWVRILTGDSVGEISDSTLPARLRRLGQPITTANGLDNILENGFATVSSSAFVAAVNGPPGAAAGVVLTLLSTNTTTGVQMYWNQSGNDRGWTRRRASSVWGPWQLVSLPILGTVSQAAGVPTGAIIERGSNANGEYVRFADGTQICMCADVAANINIASGNVFWSNILSATFPVSFVGTPYGFGAMSTTINGWVNARVLNTTSMGFSAWSSISRTGDIVRVGAIGRWF